VIAYKQPITGPEILDIRGVQGAGVLKTLLDRKLIATAGRKNVLGKPMMYKTTREFLIHFGLDSLAELPTLKEFEELGRMALTDEEVTAKPETTPVAEAKAEVEPDASAPEEPDFRPMEVAGGTEPKPDEPPPSQENLSIASAADESADSSETQDATPHA
jgi:segregation and condensation protein B